MSAEMKLINKNTVKHFKASFPLKTQKIKMRIKWITKGIMISCKHKRELYICRRDSNNPQIIGLYKKYCKILTKIIKETQSGSIITNE
jgi:hypothetical protein